MVSLCLRICVIPADTCPCASGSTGSSSMGSAGKEPHGREDDGQLEYIKEQHVKFYIPVYIYLYDLSCTSVKSTKL